MKLNKISTPLIIIISISVIGILIILLFDWLIYKQYVQNDNLINLNNLFNSIGFILTAITIYLLYINYTQQRDEFKKMNELNRASNNELVKSNELIILNNQLEYLTSELRKKNFVYFTGSTKNIIDFYDFVHIIIYSGQSNSFKSKYLLYNLVEINIIIGLILVTNRNLNHIINNIETPSIYILNRLPTDIELIHNRLVSYSNEFKGYDTQLSITVTQRFKELKDIANKYKNSKFQ